MVNDAKPDRLARHISGRGLALPAVPHEICQKAYWTFTAVEADGTTAAFSAPAFALDFGTAVGRGCVPADFAKMLARHGHDLGALDQIMVAVPVAPAEPR